MRAFGHLIRQVDEDAPPGPAVTIETAPATNQVPGLNLNGRAGVTEVSMFTRGAIGAPGTRTFWTINATGGCVPIVAAEIVPGAPRGVTWTYLIHATATNRPLSLDGHIANPANVYVVVLAYNGMHSEDAAREETANYLPDLDPNDRIPNGNAVVIWAPFHSLAITQGAHVGVLPGNLRPTAPGGGGGGGGGWCCCHKCFITNAVCATLGKPDDCFELTTLRFYRDQVLRRSAAGRDAIAEYEAIAPGIVSSILARPDARQIHERLYRNSILPAVEAVGRGEYDRAFSIYRAMVNALRPS